MGGRCVVLGCLRDEAQVIHLTSTVTNRLKGAGCLQCLRQLERHVPPQRAMDEMLYGTVWRMISPLSTTDDAVRCRTVTSRWNVGSRHGEMGEPAVTKRPIQETLALRFLHDAEEEQPVHGRVP